MLFSLKKNRGLTLKYDVENTGKHRGFGYVVFHDEKVEHFLSCFRLKINLHIYCIFYQLAEKALAELNGVSVGGKPMKLSWYRGIPSEKPIFKLYVRNLHFSLTTDDLERIGSGCGTVIDSWIIKDKQTGAFSGSGFICYGVKEVLTYTI